MDKVSRIARHLDWKVVATVMSLLAIHGLFTSARAQLPKINYPSAREDGVSQSARNGQYVFEADLNGATVPMLFDTGANIVALRPEDAENAGIDVSRLNYSGFANTANGRTEVASVVIKTMTVGSITRHDVPAMVHRPGTLFKSLLGMSFLSRIAGFHREGDRILLQDTP